MSEKAQITFAAPAIKDLEDLQAHCSDEGSPDAGKRLTAEIVGKVERLARIRWAAASCLRFMSNICERSFTRLSVSSTGMIKTRCVLFEYGEVKDF